jgi:hypothetical protein
VLDLVDPFAQMNGAGQRNAAGHSRTRDIEGPATIDQDHVALVAGLGRDREAGAPGTGRLDDRDQPMLRVDPARIRLNFLLGVLGFGSLPKSHHQIDLTAVAMRCLL